MTHQDVIKLLELQRAVKELPSRYGFSNLGDFIRALEEFNRADGATARGTKRSTAATESTAVAPEAPTHAATERAKGKRLTEEDKVKILEHVDAGKTSAEIAEAMKCSVATVQNVKKKEGKTKPRRKTPAAESTTQHQS